MSSETAIVVREQVRHRTRHRRPSRRIRLAQAWAQGEVSRRLLLAAPLLAVGFAIFAFGGVYGWAYGAAYLLIYGALGAWAVQCLRARLSFHWKWIYAPILLFAAVVAVQYFGQRTVVAGSTFTAGFHLAAAGALFFVVSQCYRPELDPHWISAVFAGLTLLLALLAVLQILTGYNGIYWHFTYSYANPAGSFVNKNHFAGCMEMLLPIAAIAAYRQRGKGIWRQLPWLVGPGLGVAAVLLAASRGGAVSLLIEVLAATVFVIYLERRRRHTLYLPGAAWNSGWLPVPTGPARWDAAADRRGTSLVLARPAHRRSSDRSLVPPGLLALLVALVLTLTLVTVVGTDRLQARLQNVNTYAANAVQRENLNRSSMAMWRQKPWMGWGLGTWADVYPAYARFTDEAVYEFAHNDYLQLLSETGVVGAACVALFWLTWLWGFQRRLRSWAPLGTAPPAVALALAACLACLGIFVHSWVDFNLHIPANLLLFFVMIALALP